MKSLNIAAMTTSKLVERFATIGVEQDRALRADDLGRYKRLCMQMRAVDEELKGRPGDQRRSLLALYDNPNFQVRLMAAKLTLAIAPEAARQMLEHIRERRHQPQSGDAGMCLRNLERGIFVPK
ncbi:MAG TPA: DUF2019 domain-containing protein [Xanthobacteraceae bacterium]|jgi:hypothetical protein